MVVSFGAWFWSLVWVSASAGILDVRDRLFPGSTWTSNKRRRNRHGARRRQFRASNHVWFGRHEARGSGRRGRADAAVRRGAVSGGDMGSAAARGGGARAQEAGGAGGACGWAGNGGAARLSRLYGGGR